MICRNSLGRRPPARRGITILETMVVMTGVAIMLGLCAITLQLLMRMNADSQARLASAITFERLARQLRDDVRAAESATLAPAAETAGKTAGLHLTLEPAHLINYEIRESSVTRLESRSGQSIRRESYHLRRGRNGRFELRDEADGKLVGLVVTQSPGTSRTDPPRPIEVVALVGRHRPSPGPKPGGPTR
jgi:hypothetical protein